jgi:hypothetical protein
LLTSPPQIPPAAHHLSYAPSACWLSRYCYHGTIVLRALRVTMPPRLLFSWLRGVEGQKGSAMGSAHPPLEYLVSSSQSSLESFELARLNAIANLRKELRHLVDEWVEAEIQARMARWILERKRLETPDAAPPFPALSELAVNHRTAVGHLLVSRSEQGEAQPAEVGTVGEIHDPRRARPRPTKRQRIAQLKPLAGICESLFDPDPLLCVTGDERSRAEEAPEAEAGPNSLATTELQSLERGVHTGAKVLHRESGGLGMPHAVDSHGDAAEQLHFSLAPAVQGALADSDRPRLPDLLYAASNRKAPGRLCSFLAPTQSYGGQDRDMVSRAALFELRPVKKSCALFYPIHPYPHRVAAAS